MNTRGAFGGGLASAMQMYMSYYKRKQDGADSKAAVAAKAPTNGGVTDPANPDKQVASTDVPAPPAADPQPVKEPDLAAAANPASAMSGLGDPNVYAWPADEHEAAAEGSAGAGAAEEGASSAGAMQAAPTGATTPTVGG